jgi:hypothetical protein
MIRMKTMVQLEGIVTEDGKLLVQIPKNLAPGRVKITIDPIDAPVSDPSAPLTREEARRRLAAASHLTPPIAYSKDMLEGHDFTPVILPPDSPGSEVLVDEDRGER